MDLRARNLQFIIPLFFAFFNLALCATVAKPDWFVSFYHRSHCKGPAEGAGGSVSERCLRLPGKEETLSINVFARGCVIAFYKDAHCKHEVAKTSPGKIPNKKCYNFKKKDTATTFKVTC